MRWIERGGIFYSAHFSYAKYRQFIHIKNRIISTIHKVILVIHNLGEFSSYFMHTYPHFIHENASNLHTSYSQNVHKYARSLLTDFLLHEFEIMSQ